MDLGLKDKVAVVTGGSEGIGYETACILAEEGAKVVILARRPEILAKAEEKLAKKGHIEAHVQDVCDTKGYAALINEVAKRHGRLDIIINNAGGAEFGPIESTTDDQWHNAFRSNVDPAFASFRAAFPIMRDQGGGSIVNIGSIMGARSQANSANLGASKAALEQFTNIASVEGAVHNIRVNTVRLGSIRTESFLNYEKKYPDMVAQVLKTIPLKRPATPEEAAAAIVFVASDRASYITGACLAVDGALGVLFPY